MIIDAHTHLGFKNGIKASAAELISSMDEAGIDKALVFSSDLFGCSTEWLLAEITEFRERLHPIASISINNITNKQLKNLKNLLDSRQVFGCKFYVGYEHYYPYDKVLKPYLKLLENYEKPAIFHSGDTFNCCRNAKLKYAHPLHIDDVATDHPELKIVITHLGNPWIIDTAEVVYKNPNVYTDISGFVYGKLTTEEAKRLDAAMNQFVDISSAPERLLFGTDWPISDQKSYATAFNGLAHWSAEVIEKVFGLNG